MKGRLGLSTGNSQIKQRLGPKPSNFNSNIRPLLQKNDARMKLIQKKREGITDARDRLIQIGKQEDARVKLNKIKNMKSVHFKEPRRNEQKPMIIRVKGPPQEPNLRQFIVKNNSIPPLGTLKKTITPKSGLRGMTRMKAGALVRTVNGAPKMGTRPVSNGKKSSDLMMDRYHPLPSNPNVVTIRNEKAIAMQKGKGMISRSSLPQLKAKRTLRPPTSSAMSSMPSPLALGPRRALTDPLLTRTFRGNVWDPQMAPPSLPPRQEIKPARLKITTTNNYMDYDAPPYAEDNWRTYSPPRPSSVKRSYEAYEDYVPSPPKKQSVLSSNIVSRLDQPRRPTNSGYKVMVTNLHPVVTVEDVEELFRNIGTIRNARIVREGIAEVVFMNEEDAHRSVEVYHNRQLDGQAMSVTVVTKKSSATGSTHEPSTSRSPLHARYSPTPQYPSRKSGPPTGGGPQLSFPKNVHATTKSVLRTAGGSDSAYDSPLSSLSVKRSQKVDVAPDISAIHHALFSGKTSNTGSSLQVYIKLPKPPLRGTK